MRGKRPDCILLDVLMPAMGGIETLHEMMHLDPRLNVVMTSCSSSFGTIIEAFRLGARDYLVFPSRTRDSSALCITRDGKDGNKY